MPTFPPVPDPSSLTSDVVMASKDQTITGAKVFTNGITADVISLSSSLYPPDEAGTVQTALGLITSAGVPSNANGSNGWYCINRATGKLYLKTAGVWNPVSGAIDTNAGDYQAVGAALAVGSTGLAMDAGTVLAHGSGYLPNAHHPQAHSDTDHTGANKAAFGTATGNLVAPSIITTRATLAIRQDSSIYPLFTDDAPNGVSDLLLQQNPWNPEDHGWLTWSQDPITTNGTFTLAVAGTVYVIRVHLRKAVTVSNIWLHVTTAGVGLTASQCFAALCTSALAVLSATGDQSGIWNSTGLKSPALTTPQAVAAGDYLIALYGNWATSAPAFRSGASQVSINGNLSAGNSRWATADTGRTTSFPATLAALAASTNGIFTALS